MRALVPIVVVGSLAVGAAAQEPPGTQVREVTDVVHGTSIVDPYRWLEDQESAETRAWIDQQNTYSHAILERLPGRVPLRSRMADFVKVPVTGWPIPRGDRYFYSKRGATEQMESFYVRQGLNGPERRLLDPARFSSDFTKSVAVLDVDPAGSLVAYGIRDGGADETDIRVLDVETGKDLADHLPSGAHYSVILLPGRKGFLYTLRTSAGSRLYEHRLGTDPDADVLLFGEGYADDILIWMDASEDRRFFLATVSRGAGTNAPHDLFLCDRTVGSAFKPLVTGLNASLWTTFGGHRLFVRTNWNAPRWRVVEIDPANPAPERWREVIPQGDAQIDGVGVAGHRLLVTTLENVSSHLRVYEPTGQLVREIALPTLGSAGGGGMWDRDEAFFYFSSFAAPWVLYRYVPSTDERSVWFRLQVPHFDPESIEARQVWYASKDGTRVPMFVVARKGVPLDGRRPTLLTGYGGYGLSSTPWFDPAATILAERGGVFALANIRGGGEFGEPWHRAGMLEKKQNSFDDFIEAARWLIANGYTNSNQLAIQGGSNGGLLVGAAMTQRPDLFKAVVCEFPHLDMIRYHKFLRAAPWVAEYGNPDDPAAFKYLLAYSPYHRVVKGVRYPATLFVTGDHDTRVAPLHARKMTALLQAATGSEAPVLLRYDTVLGHSWGASVDRELDYRTDTLGFVLWQIGAETAADTTTSSMRN